MQILHERNWTPLRFCRVFTLKGNWLRSQVLSQFKSDLFLEEKSVTKPIGFWFRLITNTKRECDMKQLERFLTVWALLRPRPYLGGTQLTIKTYQGYLKWVINQLDAFERFAWFLFSLSRFDVDAVHWAGVKHHATDAHFRVRTDGMETAALHEKLEICSVKDKQVTRDERHYEQVCMKCDATWYRVQPNRKPSNGEREALVRYSQLKSIARNEKYQQSMRSPWHGRKTGAIANLRL